MIAVFQADGRLSNTEVARRLGVSEGTIRQRLRKLQDGGAIRFDVVRDAARMGVEFVAFIRASVAPRHLEPFLKAATQLPDLWYLATVAGRFNVIALVAARSAADAVHTINTRVERLEGVNEIEVRPVAHQIKHDFHEMVIPRNPDRGRAVEGNPKRAATRPSTKRQLNGGMEELR